MEGSLLFANRRIAFENGITFDGEKSAKNVFS
jgi:hypothetical protein